MFRGDADARRKSCNVWKVRELLQSRRSLTFADVGVGVVGEREKGGRSARIGAVSES